jgi:hypothetical protein
MRWLVAFHVGRPNRSVLRYAVRIITTETAGRMNWSIGTLTWRHAGAEIRLELTAD